MDTHGDHDGEGPQDAGHGGGLQDTGHMCYMDTRHTMQAAGELARLARHLPADTLAQRPWPVPGLLPPVLRSYVTLEALRQALHVATGPRALPRAQPDDAEIPPDAEAIATLDALDLGALGLAADVDRMNVPTHLARNIILRTVRCYGAACAPSLP